MVEGSDVSEALEEMGVERPTIRQTAQVKRIADSIVLMFFI